MPVYSFFLICPLDLESLCHQELMAKTADLELQEIIVELGGISFKASLGDGAALNHRLKTPTRILCHLSEFRARDLPKLFQKVSKMPWREWLHLGGYKWKVSAAQSRLIHTGRIQETLQEAVEKSFSHQAPKKRSSHLSQDFIPTLYARLQDDIVTISIDLSGEALSKRGDKIFSNIAPLRENLAHGLWLFTLNHLPTDLKSIELCDPMAGTGTFLFEAKSAHKNNFKRSFAYQYIPQTFLIPKTDFTPIVEIKRLIAGDLETETLKKNLEFKDYRNQVEVITGDSFQQKPSAPLTTRVIITNPPYGERIKKEFKVAELLKLYRDDWQASYVGVLAPSAWDFAAHIKEQQILGRLKFKNGGIPVCFWVLKIGHAL